MNEQTDNTPAPVADPKPSRALCTKALQGLFGTTARFQSMRGEGGDGAIGWRVLVEGRELVRVTPKNENLADYNPFDPAMPFYLLRSACAAVGLVVECPTNKEIRTRRDPKVLLEAVQAKIDAEKQTAREIGAMFAEGVKLHEQIEPGCVDGCAAPSSGCPEHPEACPPEGCCGKGCTDGDSCGCECHKG